MMDKDQNVVIGIRLCALPKGIMRIKVKYKIVCVEFQSDALIERSTWAYTANFDYDNYYVKVPKHIIKSEHMQKYDELTFIAEIQLLQTYGFDGQCVHKYTN